MYKRQALGAFATLLSSCGNDWLDLQSSTAIETDGSLTELRDFEFVLNGAYSSMQSSSYYGADMFCYGDLRGDDMKSYKSSSTNVSFYTFLSLIHIFLEDKGLERIRQRLNLLYGNRYRLFLTTESIWLELKGGEV